MIITAFDFGNGVLRKESRSSAATKSEKVQENTEGNEKVPEAQNQKRQSSKLSSLRVKK